MKIKKFYIENFKSIKNINIPLQSYGKGKSKSSVTILVGLNESGKSSILEAMSLFQEGFNSKDYEEYCFKGSNGEENIRVISILEIDDISKIQQKISSLLQIDEEFTSQIKISSLQKITWQSSNKNSYYYYIKINDDLPFYKYIVKTSVGSSEKKILDLKKENGVEEEITLSNAKSLLTTGQVLLTQKELEDQIRIKISKFLDTQIPDILYWKPKPEFLINEIIDLEEFKLDTSISIPLRNIFHIHGIDTDTKILTTIEKALKRPETKAELQAGLSKSITSYINKIWKEHKINIKVNIDANNCSVYVEDKDKEYKYFNMKQRSGGFNQFISLILSLSTTNDSKPLTDSIILLDEPEVHLHPSGIRYMRDEILKIGKNNDVIVSTHSHYMVDTTTPERHFIVSKKEISSEINQINENISMDDDQVLASAFGLNLFKELLPENIIVVEGGDDKLILAHTLNLIHNNFFYSIKSAGGASKVYGIASILSDEKVPAYFLLDDDKEGKDCKKNIFKNLKEEFDEKSVFTIRDLASELLDNSTLEDLLPIEFIKAFFEEEMKHEFILDDKLPILFQIKNQDENLKNNKEQLDSKKLKLSEKFITTFNDKKKLEEAAPKLVKLINSVVTKIRTN